jgi:hypothetical protein
MRNNFEIEYHNPHADHYKVDRELDEDNSIEGVFSAYAPQGAWFHLKIGNTYSLKLDLNRFGPPLFEDFVGFLRFMWNGGQESTAYSDAIPPKQADQRLYTIQFADFIREVPLLFFVIETEKILLYSRTISDVNRTRAIIYPGRDTHDPYTISRKQTESAIGHFLTRYYADIKAATPSVAVVEGYDRLDNFMQKVSRIV